MISHVMQGALLSYRALFTWLNPWGYLSSRIARPISLAVIFAALGTHYNAEVGRTLIGASLLAGAHAVIFGMALAVGNERAFGTMDIWLASPQNKIGAICQRALPHLLDGFVGGTITYLVCCVLFGNIPLPVHRFAGVLALALVGTFGFGLLIASVAIMIKDVFTTPNLAYLGLTLLSGALVSTANLPGFIQPLATVSPLHHIMRFAVAADPDLTDFLHAGFGELSVGLLWFGLGSLLIQRAVHRSRR